MRGFKAKALRRLSESIYGKEEPRYEADLVKGDIVHMKNGVPVLNTIRRADKARKLYRKMKKELTHG